MVRQGKGSNWFLSNIQMESKCGYTTKPRIEKVAIGLYRTCQWNQNVDT